MCVHVMHILQTDNDIKFSFPMTLTSKLFHQLLVLQIQKISTNQSIDWLVEIFCNTMVE